ncbi:MAG TPA: hypothetical protein VJQ58_14740 [Burkholderiales bacterium]|nr:hypothetical protein [Burkholderiales bacterium]
MVNDRALAGVLLLALPLACVPAARAAEAEEAMRSDVFVITPRLWYATYSSPTEVEAEQARESVRVPMAGVSLTYAPKSAPNLAILATAMRGDGEGTLIDQFFGVGTTSTERRDLELLVRYNLLGARLYVLGGWRHVKFTVDDRIGAFVAHTDVTVSGPEFGFGSTQDLTRDGRHQVFGNFVALYSRYQHDYRDNAGFVENHSFRSWGLDLNLGYQFWITPSFNFSARYRMFTFEYKQALGSSGYKDSAIFYGPEIGLSLAF